MLASLEKAAYTDPTPVQAGIIPRALAGVDVLGQARTGTGKTAAFAIPILEQVKQKKGAPPQAIVLVPTRELAVQVRDDASAIDSQVLEVELRSHPELAARLRVIEALGPSTIQPVAVSLRIASVLRSRIQDALVSMHRDPETVRALARGLITRFVPVGPHSYRRHQEDGRRLPASRVHGAEVTS